MNLDVSIFDTEFLHLLIYLKPLEIYSLTVMNYYEKTPEISVSNLHGKLTNRIIYTILFTIQSSIP